MVESTRRAVLAAVGAGVAMSATAGVGGADAEDGSNESQAESETQREDAVRVVHLSPDAPAVDVYVDGEPVFENVEPFAAQSNYRSYAPGSYDIAVVPAGGDLDEAVLETEIDLESGEYTIAAIGEVCATSDRPLELVSLEDDNGPTEAGAARLRGVHASPDAPAIDVVSDDGTVLFEELEFGEAAYASIPAGERVIGVRETGEEEPLARFAIEPEAGRVYTAFGVGYLNPEDAPGSVPEGLSFSLGLTEDAAPGEK